MNQQPEEPALPKDFVWHLILIVGIIFIILLPRFCFKATDEDIQRVREQLRQQELEEKKHLEEKKKQKRS